MFRSRTVLANAVVGTEKVESGQQFHMEFQRIENEFRRILHANGHIPGNETGESRAQLQRGPAVFLTDRAVSPADEKEAVSEPIVAAPPVRICKIEYIQRPMQIAGDDLQISAVRTEMMKRMRFHKSSFSGI